MNRPRQQYALYRSLKDFNLLSDILPRADDALGAAVSLAVDPELEALIGIDSDFESPTTAIRTIPEATFCSAAFSRGSMAPPV